MCMNILSACMSVYYIYAMLLEAKEITGSHKTRVRDGCEPDKSLENHLRSSKRASALNY